MNAAAWLVDLDGTLYHATPVKLAMAAELVLLGPHVVRMLRTFRQNHELLRRMQHDDFLALNAPSPFHAQLSLTALELGTETDRVRRVVDRWMFERPTKWLRRFPRRSLLQEIAAFRAAGGRTALVSDYPSQLKLNALGATHLFDVVVASGEPEGPARLKPAPDGLLAAAARLGIEPERCLMIGDRQDADGAAAAAAQMAFRLIV